VTNISLGLGGIAGNLAGGFVKEASGSFVTSYVAMAVAGVLAAGLSFALPGACKAGKGERPTHA
jgi:predicted MFS family arabinose efflux permease